MPNESEGRRQPDIPETSRRYGKVVGQARLNLVAAQGRARPSRLLSDRIKAKVFPRAFNLDPITSYGGQGSAEAQRDLGVAQQAFLDALAGARSAGGLRFTTDQAPGKEKGRPEAAPESR